MADIQSVVSDPDFKSLSPTGQRKLLEQVNPDIKSLSDQGYQKLLQQALPPSYVDANGVANMPARNWLEKTADTISLGGTRKFREGLEELWPQSGESGDSEQKWRGARHIGESAMQTLLPQAAGATLSTIGAAPTLTRGLITAVKPLLVGAGSGLGGTLLSQMLGASPEQSQTIGEAAGLGGGAASGMFSPQESGPLPTRPKLGPVSRTLLGLIPGGSRVRTLLDLLPEEPKPTNFPPPPLKGPAPGTYGGPPAPKVQVAPPPMRWNAPQESAAQTPPPSLLWPRPGTYGGPEAPVQQTAPPPLRWNPQVEPVSTPQVAAPPLRSSAPGTYGGPPAPPAPIQQVAPPPLQGSSLQRMTPPVRPTAPIPPLRWSPTTAMPDVEPTVEQPAQPGPIQPVGGAMPQGDTTVMTTTRTRVNNGLHAHAQEMNLPGSPAGQKATDQIRLAVKSNYGHDSISEASPQELQSIDDWLIANKRLPTKGEIKPK